MSLLLPLWLVVNTARNGWPDTWEKLKAGGHRLWVWLLTLGSLCWAIFTVTMAMAALASVIRLDWPNAAAQAVLALVSGVTLRWLTRRGR